MVLGFLGVRESFEDFEDARIRWMKALDSRIFEYSSAYDQKLLI